METQSGALAKIPDVDPQDEVGTAALRSALELGGGIGQRLPFAVPMGREFQGWFGIGRSTQGELVKRGEVKSYLAGDKRGRRIIIVQSYIDYVARQQQRERDGEIGIASPNPRARKQRELTMPPARDTATAPPASKKRTGRVARQSGVRRAAR